MPQQNDRRRRETNAGTGELVGDDLALRSTTLVGASAEALRQGGKAAYASASPLSRR
jgi:hypothetical protein